LTEQWEYKQLRFGPNGSHLEGELDHELRQAGVEGWEAYHTERYGSDLTVFLKRRRGAVMTKAPTPTPR